MAGPEPEKVPDATKEKTKKNKAYRPPRPEVELPPAKPIFSVETQACEGSMMARTGTFLGQATPTFMHLTSKGLPLHLRPEVLQEQQGADKLLYAVPGGDLMIRREVVEGCPDAASGCRGFYPHFREQLVYCSYRNARLEWSVHGGDAICSVETQGGRQKLGPNELLDLQRVMRADVVAAPGEEVPMDVTAPRRLNRAVGRAGEWLRDILEAKAQDAKLDFDWHVMACIQGGADVALREKACAAVASMPVAGFWIGGLGYNEKVPSRVPVLQATTGALPAQLPRALPLNRGTPIEVLQAVLFGVDVFEVPYPMQIASKGLAFLFDWDMPADEDVSAGQEAQDLLASLVGSSSEKSGDLDALEVKQLYFRDAACREDFGPISESSAVNQYSRAYLYHLCEVRELLATMLIAQHNLHVYTKFFEAIRHHAKEGSLKRYAAWFLKTQTGAPPSVPEDWIPRKKQRKA